MKDLWEIIIDEVKETEKYFRNYLKYAKIIKKEAEKTVGKVDGYVFGSVLSKKEIPQDIDILLISPAFSDPKKRSQTRTKIYKRLKISWPFEVHLITPEQYKNWYRFFIKKKVKI